MTDIALSILICSHPHRAPLLSRTLWQLKQQLVDSVEIVVELNTDPNKRGIGRNGLIDKAKGKYCVFVDDDDVVSEDYLERILTVLKSEPDICSIIGLVTSLVDHQQKGFILSTHYKEIFSLPSDNHVNDTYHRYSSHLCPIRTEIARQVRFPEDMYREDNGYSNNLKKYPGDLKEVFIDSVIYYYFSRIKLQ